MTHRRLELFASVNVVVVIVVVMVTMTSIGHVMRESAVVVFVKVAVVG